MPRKKTTAPTPAALEIIDTHCEPDSISQTDALAVYEPPSSTIAKPVMSVTEAAERRKILIEFIQSEMKEGVDFGRIPGCGDKPTLYQPGADKLATLFGLSVNLICTRYVEDFEKGIFHYVYRCEITKDGAFVAAAEGSCNSREDKYRWRKAERICPSCGTPAIIEGKAEYGGGFVCFKKKGGCGAKFTANDPAIIKQPHGRVENDDIYSLINTIMKMAEKRAYVAAVRLAVSGSEFFTQDIEDLPPGALGTRPDSGGLPASEVATRTETLREIKATIGYLRALDAAIPATPVKLAGVRPSDAATMASIPTVDIQTFALDLHAALLEAARKTATAAADDALFELTEKEATASVIFEAARAVKQKYESNPS